ncbi:hypothetical protein [Capnocytophaga haemolytica]|nr:hypothetical protein [Capnocytophaga haemolytica]
MRKLSCESYALAIDALELMQHNKITQLLLTEGALMLALCTYIT